MPAGLIHDQHGVGVRGDGLRYLPQMQVHRGRVVERQDQPRALALLRADAAEDIGRLGTLIVGRARASAALGSPAHDLILLADPRFVLELDLYPCARGPAPRNILYERGEVFLNAPSLSDGSSTSARERSR